MTDDNEQAALWNGTAGRAWVDAQGLLDRMFQPFADVLTEAATALSPHNLLDIGCGTGATTFGVARALGANARCTGIDISEPMLDLARRRTAAEGVPADFVLADAESHAFPPAAFDLMISRFGVMFFSTPIVAFRNLRLAAATGCQLRLIAWRRPGDNPFMTVGAGAAAPWLTLPSYDPNAPGQFGFADPDRVRRILAAAGWSSVDLTPLDAVCTFPEAGLDTYIARFGPVGRALTDADHATRDAVIQAVRAAFEPFVHGETVSFTAACWMITGRAA